MIKSLFLISFSLLFSTYSFCQFEMRFTAPPDHDKDTLYVDAGYYADLPSPPIVLHLQEIDMFNWNPTDSLCFKIEFNVICNNHDDLLMRITG